jgi:hypothetical protein
LNENTNGLIRDFFPKGESRLYGGAALAPPALIIQDELHLISGPLGTVAALYDVVLDRLATRVWSEQQVRPKIVASTATVRRAGQQIKALFDRHRTEVFPPPGLSRRNSFFAVTAPPKQKPARLYVSMVAPGKGPKLIFLRTLTTLLAAAEKQAQDGGDADAYLTALCYFNALRELGGARRIVEDEVRAKLATYGTERCRIAPPDQPLRPPPAGRHGADPRAPTRWLQQRTPWRNRLLIRSKAPIAPRRQTSRPTRARAAAVG